MEAQGRLSPLLKERWWGLHLVDSVVWQGCSGFKVFPKDHFLWFISILHSQADCAEKI